MTPDQLQNSMDQITQQLDTMRGQLYDITAQTIDQMNLLAVQAQNQTIQQIGVAGGGDFFMQALTVLILAGIVGYYVVWNVTPALHAPLMGITNAISSVIILGALLATGAAATGLAHGLGFVAITLASVNIFGGFMVTYRMLDMFRTKIKK